jgi:hypothetical protein
LPSITFCLRRDDFWNKHNFEEKISYANNPLKNYGGRIIESEIISKFINHETMVRMVRGEVNEKVIVEENEITRDSKSKSVINKYLEKKFRFDYDKRVIDKINDGHINTLPFGF